MIDIDHLALQLPAALAPRAARIARLAGEALARHDIAAGFAVAHLSLAPLHVDARASDRAVGELIAGHVAAGLRAHAAGQGAEPRAARVRPVGGGRT